VGSEEALHDAEELSGRQVTEHTLRRGRIRVELKARGCKIKNTFKFPIKLDENERWRILKSIIL